MAWPAIRANYNQEQFRKRVESLTWPVFRPSKIMIHNTGAPSMPQWIEKADEDFSKNRTPGITRINNLIYYFEHQAGGSGWSGCPHLFIAPPGNGYGALIWELNALDKSGVGSPSFNRTAIHIEMCADFALGRDDDDAGPGLSVKNNTIFATAVLCDRLGLDPMLDVILHKDDPKTTHDCPGMDFARDRQEVLRSIAALLEGGDHDPDEVAEVITKGDGFTPPSVPERRAVTTVGKLNVRTGPGIGHQAVTELWKGAEVVIIGEAKNGSTGWSKIRTPAGHQPFWVASRFLKTI